MFKFIILSVLSVIGASYATLGLVTTFGLGLYTSLFVAGVVGLTLAMGFVIPVGKTYLTGLALNSIGGSTSGGYNRVS